MKYKLTAEHIKHTTFLIVDIYSTISFLEVKKDKEDGRVTMVFESTMELDEILEKILKIHKSHVMYRSLQEVKSKKQFL